MYILELLFLNLKVKHADNLQCTRHHFKCNRSNQPFQSFKPCYEISPVIILILQLRKLMEERLSNLLKNTQLVNSRAGIRTLAAKLQSQNAALFLNIAISMSTETGNRKGDS